MSYIDALDASIQERDALQAENAKLVAAVTEINNEAVSKIQQFKDSNAKLVAALTKARTYLDGYGDDLYDPILKQIDEALQQSTEKP